MFTHSFMKQAGGLDITTIQNILFTYIRKGLCNFARNGNLVKCFDLSFRISVSQLQKSTGKFKAIISKATYPQHPSILFFLISEDISMAAILD